MTLIHVQFPLFVSLFCPEILVAKKQSDIHLLLVPYWIHCINLHPPDIIIINVFTRLEPHFLILFLVQELS